VGSRPVLRIVWVFFDLGGVLYDLDYRGLLRRFCKICHKKPEDLQNLLHDHNLYRNFEMGSMTAHEFHDTVTARLSCDMSFEEFSVIWNSLLVKNRRMFRTVHRLKEQVGVLVLSNTNEINASFMDSDIRAVTDKIIYSYQVRCLKPERRIFEKALQLSGAIPEETLFIDDRKENLRGAEALGIQTHHFQGRLGLLKTMRAHGL
jgi:putative hydrolase of the HAD superfamily